MAQAKKKRSRATSARPRGDKASLSGVFSGSAGMLFAGIVIGSLGTTLWHGWRGGDSEVGSGIRRMMEDSSERSTGAGPVETTPAPKPEPQQTNYDFFTVLPEIEVVVSEGEDAPTEAAYPEQAPAEPASTEPALPDPASPETEPAETEPAQLASSSPAPAQPADPPEKPQAPVREAKPEPVSTYMLQAGSFSRPAEADRQKARIALLGLSAGIQKVTIQGRGDFYRVRLGPYASYSRMEDADRRLKGEGIQAIRLKVSRPTPDA
ncbi:MAG: SPOR domain-containing protein [Gammaproteobacteria bacterium]|nr:SPOR domain-containing protein [Gammaproteobacteria bacterium]